ADRARPSHAAVCQSPCGYVFSQCMSKPSAFPELGNLLEWLPLRGSLKMLERPGLAHSLGVESTTAPQGCNGKRPVAFRPPAINLTVDQIVDARSCELT